MSFDLYAELSSQSKCPTTVTLPAGLASGFVDGCTAWFATAEIDRAHAANNNQRKEFENQRKEFERKKTNARNCYIKQAEAAELLSDQVAELLDPVPCVLQPGWLAFDVSFTLQTPWYSKDDRPLHVLDNPVRKDRVFGVPFMSAASWKGLLRWSFGMTTGLIGPTPIEDENKRKQAEATIRHLFGNEKGAGEDFQRGVLAFYPVWFRRIGFEVINPHNRARRAGTQPIYYEVVPAGTPGTLRLLYATLPCGEGPAPVAINSLIDAIEALLVTYGFSAKRTGGWGTASIEKWTARRRDHQAIEEESAAEFKKKLKAWLRPVEADDE